MYLGKNGLTSSGSLLTARPETGASERDDRNGQDHGL